MTPREVFAGRVSPSAPQDAPRALDVPRARQGSPPRARAWHAPLVYRDARQKNECPMCGEPALQPRTRIDAGDDPLYVVMAKKEPELTGLFPSTVEQFRFDRARVCLACGYVALSLAPSELARLREHLDDVEPEDTSAT